MNEIPFSEIYWNKWFQIGGVVMFLIGWLFALYVAPHIFKKKYPKYYTDGNGKIIVEVSHDDYLRRNTDNLVPDSTHDLYFASRFNTMDDANQCLEEFYTLYDLTPLKW